MKIKLDALSTSWFIETGISDKNLEIEIKKIIHDFETDYTRFNNTSFIGQLNNEKVLVNPPIELVHMLEYAINIYEISGGLFNITIGAELEKNGYGLMHGDETKLSKDLRNQIQIRNSKIEIHQDLILDLGGFGKGWLIEKLGAYLENRGVQEFYINGGGDILVKGTSPVFIEHPNNSSQHIGRVNLTNKSLASSSNLKRSWAKNGHTYKHIVNPLGSVDESILSIHVLSDSILFADTFATIFMLVKRVERLKIAEKLNLEFLEITDELSVFRTNGFRFIGN